MWSKIIKKPKIMQLGGLFGQGLGNGGNNDYNYQNTGHRGTSYDTLQYIPDTPTPDVTPAMLNAFMSKYQLKSKFDPTKHIFDTSDLDKDMDLHSNDKGVYEAHRKQLTDKFANWVRANNFDETALLNSGLYATQLKNELVAGTTQNKDRKINNKDIDKKYGDFGLSQVPYTENGDIMYKRVNESTGKWEFKPSKQLSNLNGWNVATNKDAYFFYDKYITAGDGNRGTISAHYKKFTEVKKDIQEYFKNSSSKQFQDAKSIYANPEIHKIIDGVFNETVALQTGVTNTQDGDNFKQLATAYQALTESIPQEDIITARQNFTSTIAGENKQIIVTVRNEKGEPLTTTGEVYTGAEGQQAAKKTGTYKDMTPEERETAFKAWFMGYIYNENQSLLNTTANKDTKNNMVAATSTKIENGLMGDGAGGFKKVGEDITDTYAWANSVDEPVSLFGSPFELDSNSSLKGNPLLGADWSPFLRANKEKAGNGLTLMQDHAGKILDLNNITRADGSQLYAAKVYSDGRVMKKGDGSEHRLNSKEVAENTYFVPDTERATRIPMKNGVRLTTANDDGMRTLKKAQTALQQGKINKEDFAATYKKVEQQWATSGVQMPMTAVAQVLARKSDNIALLYPAKIEDVRTFYKAQLLNPNSEANKNRKEKKRIEALLTNNDSLKEEAALFTTDFIAVPMNQGKNTQQRTGALGNSVNKTKVDTRLNLKPFQQGGVIDNNNNNFNQINIDDYLASIPKLTIEDLY